MKIYKALKMTGLVKIPEKTSGRGIRGSHERISEKDLVQIRSIWRQVIFCRAYLEK
ncbi:MAG: hypothetical protein ACTS8H_04155 [Arsenophonus sp. NC-PE1-MAG3]